jgi:nitrogenase-associated protein
VKIVFWEKPGCMGNARQRALLATGGHEIEVKSLPDHKWTRKELAPFFEGLAVEDWFNLSSRRVKESEVIPEALDEDGAYRFILADPILVRRPLLEIDGEKKVGFDLEWIESKIGPLPSSERVDRVRSEDLTSCPGEKTGVKCGDPRE